MTPELETYFNTYFELFRSKGWKQLVTELQANATQITNIAQIKDPNDLFFRKGQLDLIASLVSLPDTINASHEEATAEKEEQEDVETV